ncbi:outer membrane channel protein [Pseudooceanicola marinus]|uniref:Outer membrane channel protein n=1 Tax=Pseudooceanicola marinus TaxID=396013 RepID=A0A1X6Z6E0_9RHOB|nr:TolC family protein [Pseudooceanicola marinus]PJE32295.1 TolC family protein [Pseudooceanicola marinus]SLN40103.1 outer membrane channel protein [Pseudooceanicola marinus]
MSIGQRALAAVVSGIVLAGCQHDASSGNNLKSLLDQGPDAETRALLHEDLAEVLERQEKAIGTYTTTANTGAAAVPMNALIENALARNPTIGHAAQAINQADAERMRAIYARLPQVYINFSYDGVRQDVRDTDNAVFERGKANYPVATSSASLVQPLFDPARRYRVQRAKSVQSGAEVDYIAAVRDVVFEVFDNYIVASQAKARIASLQERRYLLNRQINSQGALVDTGLSNVLQSSSLRSERDTIAAEESLESARRAEALSNLSQLTGLVVSDLAPLDFPDDLLNAPGRVNVDQAVSTALENNPAIMSAALQVVSTEFERKEAHASDISPVLEAYATIEREDRSNSRFGGGSLTVDETVGVSLTIPIFNANGTGLSEPTKRMEVRTAALRYHARKRSVETEVRTAHARLGELSKAIRQSKNAAYHASRALEVERNRVSSGESVDLAVAARQLRVNESRAQVAFYEAEFMRAWARLNYLMGADLTTQQGF